MRIKTFYSYKFNELSEGAQKRAIADHQFDLVNYPEWDEWLLEDFKAELEDLGYKNAKIDYSGFCSQGDGLSFTCDIDLSKLLDNISDNKRKVLAENVECNIYRRSFYRHSNTMNIEYNHYSPSLLPRIEKYLKSETENILDDAKSKAKEFYRRLDTEYGNLTCRESVIDYLTENEFEFNESGVMI